MTKRSTWAAAALLGGVALRFLFLNAKSMWFDEASTLLLAGRPIGELTSLLVRNEMNPPLYYALMHLWLELFSDARVGLRVFSALCGAASLFAFRALADRLLPERARLPALWFAAASSFWIHIAQDARAYSLLLLISLLSTRAALELSEKPRARVWAAYAVLAALGLWTHYYFAILLAGHAAWLLRRGARPLHFALAHAATALMFAPWIGHMAAQKRLHVAEAVVGEALTLPRILELLSGPFFDVSFLGLALPGWTGAAIGACFVALALRGRSEDRRAFDFCAAHVAAAFAVVIAVELFLGRPVTQSRYFTPLSPILLLLLALGARRAWTKAAAGAVLAAGVAGYFFAAVMIDPRLEALSALIRRSSEAAVPVVHLGKYYYLPLRVYYLPERRHLLVEAAADGMDYRGMPPYSGVLAEKDLAALGPIVVVDESRTLSPERVSLTTGARLAALRR